ncbi:MAG: CAP domain-containing protein [Bifidobacteriaceae bacterium]|jgi:uncharacterized protein YkwD|nr:CAP domain-containing protein [Bifidobacteriaceae bacterium]
MAFAKSSLTLFSLALTASLAGTPGPAIGAPAAAHPPLDPTSKQSVQSAYRDWLVPALDRAVGWTGSVKGCVAGAPSAAAQAATFEAVNYHRAMAGLSPVAENPDTSRLAQQAALIMAAKGDLSHNPPASWPCYTRDGAVGAANSNLYFGQTAAAAVEGYVMDVGVGSLGHRRWVLHPGQTTMGSGSTAMSNALWVTDAAGSRGGRVPWPSAGFFPAELLPPGMEWSLMDYASGAPALDSFRTWRYERVGQPAVSVAKATKNGKAVAASSSDLGEDGVKWTLPSYTQPKRGAVDVYRIEFAATPPPAGFVDDGAAVRRCVEALTAGGTCHLPDDFANPAGAGHDFVRDSYITTQLPDGSETVANEYSLETAQKYLAEWEAYAAWIAPPEPLEVKVFVASSPIKAVKAVKAPKVSGKVKVGAVRRVTRGTWNPTDAKVAYQWLRDGKKIRGATKASYRLRKADGGRIVALRVTVKAPGRTPWTKIVGKAAIKR